MTGGLRPPIAVTFDVTGTLMHCPELGSIYSRVLARHGVSVSAEAALQAIRRTWEEMQIASPSGIDRFGAHPRGAPGWWGRFLTRVCEHLEVGPPTRFAAAELFDRFARPDAWALYPEVPRVLQALTDRGIRLAVISNWDGRLRGLLDGLGISGHFEVMAVSSELGVEKPNPRMFTWTLDRLRVEADVVIHVGDQRIDDFEGATAVGMRALLLDRARGVGLAGLVGLLG